MSRYMKTAAEANEVARKLLDMVPSEHRPWAAELIARLVNLGIRCSPRGVQHTVRLNAVREAVCDLPVRVGMVERTDDKTGKTYNALTTEPLWPKGAENVPQATATVEGASEED